jgi:hypothetical protein
VNDAELRRYEMLIRVRDFGQTHSAAFPTGSLGAELFSEVDTVIGELSGHATAQVSSASSAKQGTSSRGLARATLRESMEAISLTARAIALDMPTIAAKFRMPHNASDQTMLATAKAFAADAAALSAEFIRHEMPATFLADLNADIADFERAISDQNQSREGHVSSTVSVGSSLDKGMRAVRKLNAVVQNRFRSDKSTLAAWLSASHVERHTRRTATAPEPPPAPPQPPAA